MIVATDIYKVFEAAVIMGGIIILAMIAAAAIYAVTRESEGRPLLPWGARMRVEREKARLELDALEVKRLAVGHQRDRVMEAMKEGQHDEVERLGLPSGEPVAVRKSLDHRNY